MEDYGVVEIDYDLFTEVSLDYSNISDALQFAIDDVNNSTNCFSDLLSQKFEPYGVVQSIDEVKNEIEKLLVTISDAISLYKYVDEQTELEVGLLSSMFSVADNAVSNLFAEPEESNYSNLSYEERAQMLREMIEGYKETLVELQTEFNNKYGKGVPLNSSNLLSLLDVFLAFDLYDKAGFTEEIGFTSNFKSDGQNYLLEGPNVVQMLQYCSKNGIMDKIVSYMNGASWEDSGLASFYDNKYFTEVDVIERLYFCGQGQANDLYFSYQNGKITDVDFSLREWLKSNCESWSSSYSELQEKGSDYARLKNDISILENKIYDLEQEEGLFPYKEETKKEEFLSWLNKNYSNLEIKSNRRLYSELSNEDIVKNLTQEEKALYAYLYNQDPSRAEEFILKMEDTIYMRQAYNNASALIEKWSENGLNGWDSFAVFLQGGKDGVIEFADGIKDFFVPDGIRGIHQYESAYIVQLLSEMDRYEGIGGYASEIALVVSYNTGVSTGKMVIPSMVGLLPIPGAKFLSTALFGISNAGSATEKALQQGHGIGWSRLYGIATGLSKTVTQKLLGKIPGFSDLKGDKSTIWERMLSGGMEKFAQTYMDKLVSNIILGENNNLLSPELFFKAVEQGIYGMGTTGIMNLGQKFVDAVLDSAVAYGTNGLFTSHKDFLSNIEAYLSKPSKDVLKNFSSETTKKIWSKIKELFSIGDLVSIREISSLYENYGNDSDQFITGLIDILSASNNDILQTT